jgi:propanol-preferring alcohol dehydrogenase
MEKEIKSVANVTHQDLEEFLPIAARVPLRVEIQEYALEDANTALMALRSGHVRGAKVLKISAAA